MGQRDNIVKWLCICIPRWDTRLSLPAAFSMLYSPSLFLYILLAHYRRKILPSRRDTWSRPPSHSEWSRHLLSPHPLLLPYPTQLYVHIYFGLQIYTVHYLHPLSTKTYYTFDLLSEFHRTPDLMAHSTPRIFSYLFYPVSIFFFHYFPPV